MRCLRRCRARPSALNVLASVVSTDTSPLHQFDSSQSTVDVDAGASGASGRARISGLIGLLMRPRKAKGRRARRVTVELAYCSSSTFRPAFTFIFDSQKARCSCDIERPGHGLRRLDTPHIP